MADFTEIIQEINTNLPDNNTQAITAAKLRTTLIDLTNTIDQVQTDYETDVNDQISDVIRESDIDDNLQESKTDKVVSNARIAVINNELQELNESLREKVNITFSNNGIILYESPQGYSDGTISPSTAYKYSDPIFIKTGWIVSVFSRGAGYEAICKCDSSGNFIDTLVGVSATPIPTERQLYTYTAIEDCYIRVCGQFYFTGEYAEAWYLGDINVNRGSGFEEKTLRAELTMAILDPNGLIYQVRSDAQIEASARKAVASVYWIELGEYENNATIKCNPYVPINTGETYKIYFYNSSFSAISNTELTSSTSYTTTIPANTKYVRLAVSSSNDLDYSVRYVEVKVVTNLLRWCGIRNYLSVSDYITTNGTLNYNRPIFEVPYNGVRQWNVGWFFYSPFYKPVGEKTKLAIVYQGSDGYKFNKDWQNFSTNYKAIVFALVHSGYNVALCSCLTGLYGPSSSSTTISDCSGDQLSINAYQSFYSYIVKNFNVEETPYVLGYSNGGLPCGRINVLGDIKAKAIAGGAITTDLVALFRVLGYAVNINKILHNCGVPEDVNVEHGGANFTTSDFEVLKSQGDILKNYSPMFMSCDGLDWGTYVDTMKNVSLVDMETNAGMVSLFENVKIQSEIPIKIWITRDDENVSYGIEKFYIEAVNKGGGRAFLRTMPNNTGKHAMGNYGNADSLKVQNYHFKDGTVFETTLFMTEVIDWFDQWK